MPVERRGPSPIVVLILGLLLVGAAVVGLEKASRSFASRPALADMRVQRGLGELITSYTEAREFVLENWGFSAAFAAVGIVFIALAVRGMKWLSAALNRWRDRAAGTAFTQERHDMPAYRFSLRDRIIANPEPTRQVVLGVADGGRAVYLTDHARSMHVHVLGQTGSGKTKSVIEPLAFQDIWRGRGVLIVDGKGSQENEERLAAMAAAAGRLGDAKVFTLNPFRASHTYNPLHLVAGADPKAVAERVFSTFSADMDVPYYRDQSSRFFTGLVDRKSVV